jgi:hypothetical protein
MALDERYLSDLDKGRYLAGKPFIVGYNLAKDATISWKTSDRGTTFDSASYPRTRVHDGYLHLATRPSDAVNNVCLFFDWSADVEFDFILVVADRMSFLSAPTANGIIGYAADAGLSYSRITDLDAGVAPVWGGSNYGVGRCCFGGVLAIDIDYGVIENVRSLKLVFYNSANASKMVTPLVYEVWVGKRWFLPYHPSYGFDDWRHDVAQESFRSDAGVQTTYRKHAPGFELDLAMPLVLTEDINSYQALIKNTRGFSDTFLFGLPSTGGYRVGNASPATFVMRAEPSISLPAVGPYERDLRLRASEVGGSYLWDESYSTGLPRSS